MTSKGACPLEKTLYFIKKNLSKVKQFMKNHIQVEEASLL
jgi:hypothetical protein